MKIKNKIIRYDITKNVKLKTERKICFEDVTLAIGNDKLLDDLKHPNKRLLQLKGYIKNQKKKPISIRLSENDLYELKRKALENSIPYQNLIQILVHQYATNKINLQI